MAPQQPNYARVSYVIPPPAQTPPRLALPPLGTPRNGSIRPLLIPAPPSTPKASTRFTQALPSDGHLRAQPHPRHRLGISSLALDSSTHLSGKACPEGILYTGGRDGQIIAWELGLKTKPRQYRYGYTERGPGWRKGRWEILTGWSDDMEEEEEEEEEIIRSDGDILGDVVDGGETKRRKTQVLTEEIPYEETWEYDADGSSSTPASFRQCLQTHTDWVNDILLCNFNQTVVSASSDGSIRAWSPHLSHTVDPVLVGMHEDYVRCLATSPHQSWVASGSFDRTIKLWDLSRTVPPTPRHNSSPTAHINTPPLSTLSLPSPSQKCSIYAIATDHVGSIIASGSPERVVRMWDPRIGKRTGKLVGHTDNIRAIVLSADGRYLLTGSADASIKLWSLTSQRCLHTFAHHTDSVWALSSQHPCLEIFYSGDRSGIVSRVDMEGSNTVDEGECIVVCNANRTSETENVDRHHGGRTSVLGDIFRLQDGGGVNGIVTMDDRLVWTATGSSSIKRWKAPSRRSLRVGMHIGRSSPYFFQSRRTSGSSDVHTPRKGASLGNENSHRFLDEVPPLAASPTNPRFGKTISGSASHPYSPDLLAQDDTTLFDIPYQSLVRLVSPNDTYALGSPLSPGGYGGPSRGRGDADVATLYSAASVKSIPLSTSRHSRQPLASPESVLRGTFPQSSGGTLSPRFTGFLPEPDSNWAPSPRAEYEARELAAAAVPLETHPDDIIQGEHGLVRSIILNDRMHALTINTAGCVAVWDIARCRCVGWFDRSDILVEMGCANGAEGSVESDVESRSPRELLETVRERIEGESVISPWSTVDTRIGNLTVHLSQRCFETEIYADEAGYGSERYYDSEQRLNVGKWVLSNIFEGFVREQLRSLRRPMYNSNSSTPSPPGTHRHGLTGRSALDSRPPPSSAETDKRNRSLSALTIAPHGSNTSRTAVSTVITTHSLTTAILPDTSLMSKRRPSFSLAPPLIPIVAAKDAQAIPVAPLPGFPSMNQGTPTPRPRPAIETSDLSRSLPNKESDYFTVKGKRLPASGTTLDDFSGWGGPGSKEQDKDSSISQTPVTPGGGGFMGRLRQFGRSSRRPSSGELTTTPGGSTVLKRSSSDIPIDTAKGDETDGSESETDQSRFLGTLATLSFHPPTATDAPPLSLPLDTEVVLAEETQSGWSNIYRGTVATSSQDTALLTKVMPIWLMQYLLTNKIPIVPNIKVSFGVVPWTGKKVNGQVSSDTPNPPSRLTANRYLRVRKILVYVQDKIDKSPSRAASRASSISGGTPRSSAEGPRAARSGGAASHSGAHTAATDESKRSRPEDVYELLCNDVVLPLNMTLATIRHYVWRSSAEVVLYYRKKV